MTHPLFSEVHIPNATWEHKIVVFTPEDLILNATWQQHEIFSAAASNIVNDIEQKWLNNLRMTPGLVWNQRLVGEGKEISVAQLHENLGKTILDCADINDDVVIVGPEILTVLQSSIGGDFVMEARDEADHNNNIWVVGVLGGRLSVVIDPRADVTVPVLIGFVDPTESLRTEAMVKTGPTSYDFGVVDIARTWKTLTVVGVSWM